MARRSSQNLIKPVETCRSHRKRFTVLRSLTMTPLLYLNQGYTLSVDCQVDD